MRIEMNDENKIATVENIKNMIFSFRGLQVMIDRDLADLYGAGTKVLNQAVKRNIERFPDDFRFQLSDNEKTELVTNCDRYMRLKHSSPALYYFDNILRESIKYFKISAFRSKLTNQPIIFQKR